MTQGIHALRPCGAALRAVQNGNPAILSQNLYGKAESLCGNLGVLILAEIVDEGFQLALFDGFAELGHQLLVVVEVVDSV